MPVFLASEVQRRPFAVPVEWDTVIALIHIVQLLKVLIFYRTRTILIEKSESNLVLCVWPGKEVLENAPVMNGNTPGSSSIGHTEKDRILVSFDFVLMSRLGKGNFYELGTAGKVTARTRGLT